MIRTVAADKWPQKILFQSLEAINQSVRTLTRLFEMSFTRTAFFSSETQIVSNAELLDNFRHEFQFPLDLFRNSISSKVYAFIKKSWDDFQMFETI